MRRPWVVLLGVVLVALLAVPVAIAAGRHRERATAHPPGRPPAAAGSGQVRVVQEISRDRTRPVGAAEPDTQAEPDVAVSPLDTNVVVAVFQQGRFPEGASASPGYATSHDGGATWVDGDLPGLTKTSGGAFEGASDPVVAFGPDGTVYAQTLARTTGKGTCRSAVAVQRSDDGGLTFGAPVLVHSDPCTAFFNDKSWITVDTFRDSPHHGRVYAVWDRVGPGHSAPQVLRFSDDRGRTWSPLKTVSPVRPETVGAQPMVLPGGDLVDVYLTAAGRGKVLASQTSTDGGDTFSPPVTIAAVHDTSPRGLRAGPLPSATVDPVTGRLFVVWQDARFRADRQGDVVLAWSTDHGRTWSQPRRVTSELPAGKLDHFTPDVAAFGHEVAVAYRTRDDRQGRSRLVAQRLTRSLDDGATFSGETVLGPPADLTWAASSRGRFLGDYMGLAASAGSVYAVWCVSSAPPTPGARYHQTTWAAAISR